MDIWNYIVGAVVVLSPLILTLIVSFFESRQAAKEEREIYDCD